METEGAAYYHLYTSYRENYALKKHNCPFFAEKAGIRSIIGVNIGNINNLYNVKIVKILLTFVYTI